MSLEHSLISQDEFDFLLFDWLKIDSLFDTEFFSHLDRNTGGREFPEHNFVFGENFKQVLVSAGLDRLFDDEA